jgi:hypothetical protein
MSRNAFARFPFLPASSLFPIKLFGLPLSAA